MKKRKQQYQLSQFKVGSPVTYDIPPEADWRKEVARIRATLSKWGSRKGAKFTTELKRHQDGTPYALSVLRHATECLWSNKDGEWHSRCGEVWSFPSGTPEENRILYCPWCGLKVKNSGR